ncbi:MAG: helix-turn-helix domain-containing protein [Acidobacteriota bacterium]
MKESEVVDVGGWLRASREAAGVSLRSIADTTKLSMRTLEALERNRIDQLPGGIYRRAIVRAYANEIGLDPEATLRVFLAQHADDLPSLAGSQVSSAHPPRPERRGRSVLFSVLGALFPLLAGAFYFTISARGPNRPLD